MSLLVLSQGGALVRILTEPLETLKLFNLTRLNSLLTTPYDVNQMLGVMELAGIRCPSVSAIRLSGSIFYPPLVEKLERFFPGAQIEVGYGSGEVGQVSGGPISAADYKAGYVGEIKHDVEVIGAGPRRNRGRSACATMAPCSVTTIRAAP